MEGLRDGRGSDVMCEGRVVSWGEVGGLRDG